MFAPLAALALVAWTSTAAAETTGAYVAASSLNLRSAPDRTAPVADRLPIGTPVETGPRAGPWVAVTTADGRRGFVHRAYLSAEVPTIAWAQRGIDRTRKPARRIAWWERAAALRPTDEEILDGLAEAYGAAGRTDDKVRLMTNRFDDVVQLSLAEATAIVDAGQAVAGATTGQALLSAWEQARAAVDLANARLATRVDPTASPLSWEGRDPRYYLTVDVPFSTLRWDPSRHHPALVLEASPFVRAARDTPGDTDDVFFRFQASSWLWDEPTWRIGPAGARCSVFGQLPLHLDLLRDADALAAADLPRAASDQVRRTREALLADILGGEPYCTPEPAALVAAATQVLAEAQVSAAERAAIERRIAAGFVESP